jgi:hypothetical protein
VLQRRHEGGKGAKLRGKSKTGASYAVGSNQLSRVRAAECAIAAFVCGSEVAVTLSRRPLGYAFFHAISAT